LGKKSGGKKVKRIVHIIPGDIWAGAESQVYTTLRELHKNMKYDIYVVLFNDGVLCSKLKELNINTYVIDESIFNSFQILKQLTSLLKDIKPQVIHTHEYKSHIISVFSVKFLKKRIPIIRTLHGLTSSPKNLKYLKSNIILLIEHFMMKYYTSCIIAVSKSIEVILREQLPYVNIVQINNSINITDKMDDSCENARKTYGIPEGTFWIGTAARLVQVKNIEMLIETARVLSLENKMNFFISIFGEGPLQKKLEEMINNYDLSSVIKLHGHTTEIMPIMIYWDAFVLTSFSEGLPMSLLEAMSIETIPICTSVGGVKEIIQDGVNGFLVPSNNYNMLADKLYYLFQMDITKKTKIKKCVKETITNQYSLNKNIKSLMDLYDNFGG
jgi:L-malate glycosyltransferase